MGSGDGEGVVLIGGGCALQLAGEARATRGTPWQTTCLSFSPCHVPPTAPLPFLHSTMFLATLCAAHFPHSSHWRVLCVFVCTRCSLALLESQHPCLQDLVVGIDAREFSDPDRGKRDRRCSASDTHIGLHGQVMRQLVTAGARVYDPNLRCKQDWSF